MIRKIITTILACGVLSSCAETVSERKSIAVDVVPMTYSLSLDINAKNRDESKERIEHYINKHWPQIINQTVVLESRSPIAVKAVNRTYSFFVAKGISPKRIVKRVEKQSSADPFNFRLSFQAHNVITPLCEYSRIGHYGETNLGCYSEGARWHSMIHPQKMIHKGE